MDTPLRYILALRKGLDSSGFPYVKIVAADGGTDIIEAAFNDTELAGAISSFGLHTHVLAYDAEVAPLGKPYWNTENDLVDGTLPLWGGTNAPGLNWPMAFLLNYVRGNGTATMLCPFIHGWSQNLGRHNHGPAFFNDPWSGFYQLGAPFYTQAQLTQFTEIGWHFLEGAAGEAYCNGPSPDPSMGTCAVTFAALVAPDGKDFTLVAINTASTDMPLPAVLAGTLFDTFCGTKLQVWRSIETEWFVRQADVSFEQRSDGKAGGVNCSLTLHLSPNSVTTISTRQGAGWSNYTVPDRGRFPVPFAPNFDQQSTDQPCKLMNPIYGAFEVGTPFIYMAAWRRRRRRLFQGSQSIRRWCFVRCFFFARSKCFLVCVCVPCVCS